MTIIPIGTIVSVCRYDDHDRQWMAHTIRRELRFSSEHCTDECRGQDGAVIFKEGNWLILTKRKGR